MADLLGFGPWIFNKLFFLKNGSMAGIGPTWPTYQVLGRVDRPARRLGIQVCRINIPSFFVSLNSTQGWGAVYRSETIKSWADVVDLLGFGP